MLEKAKQVLRLTTDKYDQEISDLIEAAKIDLGIAGVKLPDTLDALCQRAILTYVRCNFENGTPEDRVWLLASYNAQKGQMQISSKYTDWGDGE